MALQGRLRTDWEGERERGRERDWERKMYFIAFIMHFQNPIYLVSLSFPIGFRCISLPFYSSISNILIPIFGEKGCVNNQPEISN